MGEIKQIEEVQRQFTANILAVNEKNYHDRLKALNIMSLQRRRERYMIMHMWKILNGEAPKVPSVSFRPASRLGIIAERRPLGRGIRQANQTLYDDSFAMMGPTLWNILPAEIHKIIKFTTFKTSLNKFLHSIPD